MKVFIALVPNEETADRVNRWRSRYYPRSISLHPPHITLVEPFEVINLARLQTKLTRLTLPPPDLSVSGWGVFPGRKNIAHLKVELTPELGQFQREVAGLAGQKMNHPFNPHFTIGRLTDDELKAAEEALSKIAWDWRFQVDKLVIFRKEDDHWVEAVTFRPDISQRKRRPPN